MKDQIEFYNYLRNMFRNGNHKDVCPEYLKAYYEVEDALSDTHKNKVYYAMSDYIYLGIIPKPYLFEKCKEWGYLVPFMAKMRNEIERYGKV